LQNSFKHSEASEAEQPLLLKGSDTTSEPQVSSAMSAMFSVSSICYVSIPRFNPEKSSINKTNDHTATQPEVAPLLKGDMDMGYSSNIAQDNLEVQFPL
jgi:hypothetical protein